MNITENQSGQVWKIEGTLEINVAEELRQKFLALHNGESTVTVDLAGVESCDAASLQVLCSAGKAERFKIIHPSKAIVTTAAALGLKNSDFSAEAGVRAV